ncbi:hypothetical protein ACK34J_05375 [Aeromonas veronii]
MNKTLLAVALATAGLSANVMALSFTDGDFNGSVDIGGTITVPTATNQWQWATGSGLDTFTHSVTVMTNGYKTLTIPVAADTPLLVGQTKAATVGKVGGLGITPQIRFMQADGITPVTITYNGTPSGKGVMSLPVVDSVTPTTVLGSAVLNVKAGGAFAVSSSDGLIVDIRSVVYDGGAGRVFGVDFPGVADGIATGYQAASWAESLGAHSADAMVGQVQTLIPTATTKKEVTIHGDSMNSPSRFFSGSYGLGIASGDNIVVNFTNPVAAETQWKARLNIAVTYL